MDFTETESEGEGWIQLPQDRVQWQTLQTW
jgi:hypothetical protein